MAAGTLVSRATGLARTAALAAMVGVGLLSDAYTAASVVPTMLLVVVTGGTLSSALVPILSRGEDAETQQRAAGTALVLMATLAATAAIVLALASPAVARFLSLGARGQPDYAERLRLVTVLLVLVAPQVFLLAITAVTSSVLTVRGRLGIVGWAPVASNVAFLVALVLYATVVPSASDRVPMAGLLILGLGSTVASAVGCAAQLVAASSAFPRWRDLYKHRDRTVIRELRRTGGWTLFYVLTNQAGLLAVLAVAARRNGVASAYQWSFAVMQLPFALIGVTLLSATLPALARAVDDRADFNRLVRRAAVPLVALLVPCAVALALFAPVVANLLVGYGATDEDGTALVARGIAIFACALLPFAAYQVLTRSCYALKRPSWPALSNVAVNAVTAAGALLAVRPATAAGVLTVLVASYALSYVAGAVVLGIALSKVGVHVAAGLWRPALRSGAATVTATAIVLVLRALLPASWLLEVAALLAYGGVTAVGALPSLTQMMQRRPHLP
jgi:putative peptidoglycan lipid II flippase